MEGTFLQELIGGIVIVAIVTVPAIIWEIATTIKYNKEMKKRRALR